MDNYPGLYPRFLRYAAIDTRSDSASALCPSTPGQASLAKILVKELLEAGCTEVKMDSNGYVTATLPSNTDKAVPTIGFLAHMDTSPDFAGDDVRPRLVPKYNGQPIRLDPEGRFVLDPDLFPELNEYLGQDLIVTDGATLLGADDKAGIAEIIEAANHLTQHPEIVHGKVRIAFTPDEEIGRGADRFDVPGFGANFAYTLDGGPLGELEYENFNAAAVQVRIQGRNVHPGTAKGKMVNALQLAIDFHSRLPGTERPEHTEGYEGFFHLTRLDGTVESARMDYIIRDHDRERFESRKKLMAAIASDLNLGHPSGSVEVAVRNQYFNMREKIEPVMHIIDLASEAYRMTGIEPRFIPIRGGTDGAKLSFAGLPTPNLFSGGHNYHGRFEFIPLQSMEKAVSMIVNLLRLAAR